MLRKIRLTLAIVFFTLITLLFLDFTGTLHAWFGWMAKIQFLPALLALNVGVVLALVILTLLLGRVYCSIICPLGVFQDIVAWFSKKARRTATAIRPPCRGCATACWVCSSSHWWQAYIRLSHCWHPTVRTDASQATCSPLSTNGETTCWLIWLNGLTAMLSTTPLSG